MKKRKAKQMFEVAVLHSPSDLWLPSPTSVEQKTAYLSLCSKLDFKLRKKLHFVKPFTFYFFQKGI